MLKLCTKLTSLSQLPRICRCESTLSRRITAINSSKQTGSDFSTSSFGVSKQMLLRNTFIENRYPLIDQTVLRGYSSSSSTKLVPEELSEREFEGIVDESLESLYTYFDELIESSPSVNDGDVAFGSGVLTIKLGPKHGTYVINKQTPNKQIWLSSPTSGPKRYDFINKTWIYKHDGVSLYQLLNTEIPQIVGLEDVDFEKHCSYGKAV